MFSLTGCVCITLTLRRRKVMHAWVIAARSWTTAAVRVQMWKLNSDVWLQNFSLGSARKPKISGTWPLVEGNGGLLCSALPYLKRSRNSCVELGTTEHQLCPVWFLNPTLKLSLRSHRGHTEWFLFESHRTKQYLAPSSGCGIITCDCDYTPGQCSCMLFCLFVSFSLWSLLVLALSLSLSPLPPSLSPSRLCWGCELLILPTNSQTSRVWSCCCSCLDKVLWDTWKISPRFPRGPQRPRQNRTFPKTEICERGGETNPNVENEEMRVEWLTLSLFVCRYWADLDGWRRVYRKWGHHPPVQLFRLG